MKGSLLFRCLSFAVLIQWSAFATAGGAYHQPHLIDLPTLHEGNSLEPTALATGDFDEDGVSDLLSGYGSPEGGILVFHRGNGAALAIDGPGAPFGPAARVFVLPSRPDFIGAGDFDADGQWDVVAATRDGAELYLLRGDGRGGLSAAQRHPLPGIVTAFTAGEINRSDGLTDLVVALLRPEGPELLVFESPQGALRSEPERIPLPAKATSIALEQLDESYEMDLAIAAENEIFILHGRDRRRSLHREQQSQVSAARITPVAPLSNQSTLAASEADRMDLAVLATRKPNSLLDQARETLQTMSIFDEPASVLLMRLNRDAIDDVVVLRRGVSNPAILLSTAMTFMVTNRSDSGPGSLRQAILDTNANPGADLIAFDIPGGGPHTIRPLSELPAISDPVTIDGYTQPGAMPNSLPIGNNASLRIEITGAELTPERGFPEPVGLRIAAGNSVVRGLVINRFGSLFPRNAGICILLETNGGNVIEGNFIGTDVTGTLLVQKFHGLLVFSANNLIGGTIPAARNVTSGFAFNIRIFGSSATNNRVQGNYCGTNASGTGPIGGNSLIIQSGATNNTIGGTVPGASNVLSGTGDHGLSIFLDAAGNLVQGNFIGTDPTGTTAVPNPFQGVIVSNGAFDNTIGGTTPAARNIISGNSSAGVSFSQFANGNLAQGNYIGTDVTGTVRIGNTVGVFVSTANNLIGGTSTGAGNLISGNEHGVRLFHGGFFNLIATDNVIEGNVIGTNAAGTAALGNGVGVAAGAVRTVIRRNLISGNRDFGVAIGQVLSASAHGSDNLVEENLIGTDITGTAALANGVGARISDSPNNRIRRNLVSGNRFDGIGIFFGGATGNVIEGNMIGTNATGAAPLGNGGWGITVRFANNNVIGGASPGAGNVISANEAGLYLESAANVVQGNLIGTAADGSTALGNTLSGIVLSGNDNLIGGTTGGTANTIAFNGSDGIAVSAPRTGNAILSNVIFSNADLAIDLGADGITTNDAGDSDVGANNRQNFPVLTFVVSSDGTTTVTGILNSTPSTAFRLEFFASPCEPSGAHQAKHLLGFTNISTDSAGKAAFSFTSPMLLPPGSCVTATATDPGNNTSELTFDSGLGIRKFDSADPVQVGSTFTYAIVVTNNAGTTATGVTVTDTAIPSPPAGITFVSAIASQGTCNESGGTVTCGIGTLAPTSAATITLTFRARGPGQVTNTATVAGNQSDPYPADNSAVETTTITTPAPPH